MVHPGQSHQHMWQTEHCATQIANCIARALDTLNQSLYCGLNTDWQKVLHAALLLHIQDHAAVKANGTVAGKWSRTQDRPAKGAGWRLLSTHLFLVEFQHFKMMFWNSCLSSAQHIIHKISTQHIQHNEHGLLDMHSCWKQTDLVLTSTETNAR